MKKKKKKEKERKKKTLAHDILIFKRRRGERNTTQRRAEKTAQSVRSLLYIQEDMGVLRSHVKKLWVVHAYNPTAKIVL